MAVDLSKTITKAVINKAGSVNDGRRLTVDRITPSGAIVVKTDNGFRTYQRDQYAGLREYSAV
jgi:hypothetical protein